MWDRVLEGPASRKRIGGIGDRIGTWETRVGKGSRLRKSIVTPSALDAVISGAVGAPTVTIRHLTIGI